MTISLHHCMNKNKTMTSLNKKEIFFLRFPTALWFTKEDTRRLPISGCAESRVVSTMDNAWRLGKPSAPRTAAAPRQAAMPLLTAQLNIAVQCFNSTLGKWEMWGVLKSEKHRICRVKLLSRLQGNFWLPCLLVKSAELNDNAMSVEFCLRWRDVM